MSDKPYRRRNYFVKKGFQGKFMLIFIIIASVGGIVSLFSYSFFAVKKIETLLYSIHIPAKRLNEILFNEMLYSNIFSFLFVLLALLITIRWLTVKISGPLYRIKKDLEEIKKGDLSFNITLRYKDEFKDFASELNILLERFRYVFSKLKHDAEIIDQYTREIERNHHRVDIVKIRANKIINQIEEMQQYLADFKVR